MAGLTADGFEIKTMPDLVAEVSTDILDALGISIDVSSASGLGQLVRIICERFAELWQLGQAVYSAGTSEGASGARLEEVCALTGTFRIAASASFVTATLTGTPTSPIPTLTRAKTGSTGIKFATIASPPPTIDAVPDWAAVTLYVAEDRVTNSGKVFRCITGGTSAGSGGPTTSDPDITDGTAHWQYLGQGTGAVDLTMVAVDTGPLIAVAGDLNAFDTPVAGWLSVTNLLDATPGNDEMTDEDLRILREAELARPGTSPGDAIRADILALAGVTSCTVFLNDTDNVVDGMPPHSVECLIRGGDDQTIYDQLLASVAAGIATTGTSVGASVDSEGTSHVVKFTRPESKLIYVVITLTKDPAVYPLDGDEQVKLAIVRFGDAQKSGKDAVATSIQAQAFIARVGVLDVASCFIGLAPAPGTSATVAISLRQLAIFDTTRISVVSSDAIP